MTNGSVDEMREREGKREKERVGEGQRKRKRERARVDFCTSRFIRVVALRVVRGCVTMVNCDVRVKWWCVSQWRAWLGDSVILEIW